MLGVFLFKQGKGINSVRWLGHFKLNITHRDILRIICSQAGHFEAVVSINQVAQLFEGVLRRMVPQWLEDPDLAQYIVAMTPAAPKDGGTGAFYLRLRKPR